MKRLVIFIAACGAADHAAGRSAHDDCFERYAARGSDTPLHCVKLEYPIVRSMVVGPGRIRSVFAFAVPGVPPGPDHDSVVIVDATPTGRELVATGNCETRGADAVALAIDSAGVTHVLCEHDDGGETSPAVLDDMRVEGNRLVEAAPSLVAPPGSYVALALPASGPPIAFFHPNWRAPNRMPMRGSLEAMPWLAGAAPIKLADVRVHGMTSPIREFPEDDPAAILVGDRVNLVLGWFTTGWDSVAPDGYDTVEVSADGARDLGPIVTSPATRDCARVPASFGFGDHTLQLELPLRDPTGDAGMMGNAQLTGVHAAAGPTAIVRADRPCAAMLDGASNRLACDDTGCVAVRADYDTFEYEAKRSR